MKKIVNLLLLFSLVLSNVVFSQVYADSNRVEISFCVGEDTLNINGENITVEKPYVVGEGVTLVPLRVITEAFGATVNWDGETKSIELIYPDVNILLQIGNTVAEVNKKAEKLLSAPELTSGGFTMVPLRFISENFGAAVSYNNETSLITVIKENIESGNIVEGAVESKFIGDSHFKWSMENPSQLQMSERSFDGTLTSFSYDEKNCFDILISVPTSDYDFERDFVVQKSEMQGLTLIKADKNTTQYGKYYHFQAKDKTDLLDLWKYVTNEYMYTIIATFENDKNDILTEGLRILETFSCNFSTTDTYDLSNIKDGVRQYDIESLNFSINIPVGYYKTSSDDVENNAHFYKLDTEDKHSSIHVGIFSKSSVGSAKELAEKDYNSNKNSLNAEISKFSKEVTSQNYNNLSCYQYEYEVDSFASNYVARDVFFEIGEYVYNVSVSIGLPNNKSASIADAILRSIRAKEIDSSSAGILLRNINDSEGNYSVKLDDWSISVPFAYTEIARSAESVLLSGAANITFGVTEAKTVKLKDLAESASSIVKAERNEKNVKLSKWQEKGFGITKYIEIITCRENTDGAVYTHRLATVKDDMLITFTATLSEELYSVYNISVIEEIFASLKKN